MKLLKSVLYLLGLITVGIVSALAGKYLSWGGQTDEYEKYGFQIASVAGSWVSALATLAAVIAAMYALWAQIRESRSLAAKERLASVLHSRGACFNHSMSVINQLRGRLTFIQRTIVEGSVRRLPYQQMRISFRPCLTNCLIGNTFIIFQGRSLMQ